VARDAFGVTEPIKGEDSFDGGRTRLHDIMTPCATRSTTGKSKARRDISGIRPNNSTRYHGRRKYLPVRPEFNR